MYKSTMLRYIAVMSRRGSAVAQARHEAARLRRERFREKYRRVENHVVAVGVIQAEAEALERDACAEAQRLRKLADATEEAGRLKAKKKLEQVLPHLAALLRLGQSVPDVAELCEVSRAQVRAARRAGASSGSGDGDAALQQADAPSGNGPETAAHVHGGARAARAFEAGAVGPVARSAGLAAGGDLKERPS